MDSGQSNERRRAANLLGALSLTVGDKVLDAARAEAESPSAAAAIVRVGMHPGHPIDFLSLALGLSHSATVRLVDRLETDGLVQRTRTTVAEGGDRRKVSLLLTEQGQRRLEQILAMRYEQLLPLMETISESEREQLVTIIEKLVGELANRRQLPHICRLCDYEACESAGCPVRPYLLDE